MRAFRTLAALCVLALLAGCAGSGIRETVEGDGDRALWQAHKATIGELDGWQIDGKLGIRAPQQSGSGTLFWLQRRDYYDIRLSGPLGRGATRLLGHPGQVTLDIAGQGQYQAESPEALLQQQLGWSLPVSHLLWWVRGLPAPDSRSQIALSTDSRLARLQQDGWQVEYLSYAEQDGFMLPQRIKLHGRDLELTLVVTQWRPRRLGQ